MIRLFCTNDTENKYCISITETIQEDLKSQYTMHEDSILVHFVLNKCISYIFHLFKVGTITNSELCLKKSRVMLEESCAYSCLHLNVCAFYIVLYLLLNLGTVIPLYKSYTMYTKRLKIHRVPI